MAIIDNPVYSGAEPESLYAAEGSTLVGIADAIREKRDITAGIPLADMAMQIGLIESGGGTVDAASGTFEIAADISLTYTGYTLPFQMPFKPDYVVVWLDADSFTQIEAPANNRFYRISAVRLPESVPPIYNASGSSWQTARMKGGYVFPCIGSVVSTVGAASPNGYGITIGGLNGDPKYPWNISDDGRFTISNYSTASQRLLAGTYHWFALKGVSAFLL